MFTTEQGMEISELLEQVETLSKEVDVLAIADVKNAMQYIPNVNQSVCFDTIVAAYLLNPLKNDYESADIAREYLDILIDDNQIDEAQKAVMRRIRHMNPARFYVIDSKRQKWSSFLMRLRCHLYLHSMTWNKMV